MRRIISLYHKPQHRLITTNLTIIFEPPIGQTPAPVTFKDPTNHNPVKLLNPKDESKPFKADTPNHPSEKAQSPSPSQTNPANTLPVSYDGNTAISHPTMEEPTVNMSNSDAQQNWKTDKNLNFPVSLKDNLDLEDRQVDSNHFENQKDTADLKAQNSNTRQDLVQQTDLISQGDSKVPKNSNLQESSLAQKNSKPQENSKSQVTSKPQENSKPQQNSKPQENLKPQENSKPPENAKPKEKSKVQENPVTHKNPNAKENSMAQKNSNPQDTSKLKEKSKGQPNPVSQKDPKPKENPNNSKEKSKPQESSTAQKKSNPPVKSGTAKDSTNTKQNPKQTPNPKPSQAPQINLKAKQNSNSQPVLKPSNNPKGEGNTNATYKSKAADTSESKSCSSKAQESLKSSNTSNIQNTERSKIKEITDAQKGTKPSTPIKNPSVELNYPKQGSKRLEPLVPSKTQGNQWNTRTLTQVDLTHFDRFVTIGPPPSQNPPLYSRKIAKFVLDSRLRFPDAILLTCVGSFYEAYFDQAVEVAELLNIKQAKYQFAGHPYPFAGFPISSLDRHLKTLVNEHNRTVAIAEQISTNEDLERKIVRIITPGTITDENLIDTDSHNYLLAIHENELAWLDVSTGSYFCTVVDGDENKLMDQICRIAPKEIIISSDSSFSIPYDSKAAKLSTLITRIENPDDSSHTSEKLSAEKLIGLYIERNQLPSQTATRPSYVTTLRYLELDAEAIESLELLRTQNGKSRAGSLFSTISRAITAPGKRLLRDRIIYPSRVLSEIEARLDLVEKLVKNPIVREDVQDELDRIRDTDYVRLLQRFALRQGTINDLISMAKVLRTIASISSIMSNVCNPSPLGSPPNLDERISDVIRGCHETDDLTNKTQSEDLTIAEAKDFFSPVTRNVRPNYTQELSSLHNELQAAMASGKSLQAEYRTLLDTDDLNLQITPRLGAVISISKSRTSTNSWKQNCGRLNGQKLVEYGSRVMVATPKWTKLHSLIESRKQALMEAEQRILKDLFEQVASEHVCLNGLFTNLAELDVAQSFANFAVQSSCVRPSINLEKKTIICDGRHPIAEHALNLSANGSFIPNSTKMNNQDGLVQVITGPNNGGKSTYLRQIAIIHILAQAGGFVPARQATLGLVHHIFTRFGSFDNVVLGKGTFLIEMEETCKILKSADEMSLVLMDEVGRGTGIEDGLSIAYGVIKHLLEKINCRTLFSTHLPHLGPLLLNKVSMIENGGDRRLQQEGIKPEDYLKVDRLGFFCFSSSKVENGEKNKGKKKESKEKLAGEAKEVGLTFSHRVARGLNRDSSGIDIAQMVGLPKEVIKNSLFIRSHLQHHFSFGFNLDPPLLKNKSNN